MRIGIDTRFYSISPTGIGTYTYELCFQLRKFNDLELVLFVNSDSPLLTDQSFKNTEKVIVKEKLFSILELFTLPEKIKQKNLDLYHSPSFIMPFVKNLKTVMTIHDLIHIKFPDDYNYLHRLYYNLFVKKAAMKAELIITDSNSSRKDIESWLGPKKTEVIYLAASKKFSPHIGMSDLFSRFSIRPSKFILYVGNNRPNKNLKGLLLAYAEIKDKIPAYCNLLLTCNKNSELDEIMKEYFLEDSIKFIGSVSDDELILLYSYSLFFILPSIYEGFGLPVLEAMACGCPVTCSSSASLPEIGGDAVLYFEPEKTENIVNALEIMYSDNLLREQLSNKGLKQARKFSWEKTALETYNLYKEIIYETRIN